MMFIMHVIVKYNGKYYDPGTGLGNYTSIDNYVKSGLKLLLSCPLSGTLRWETDGNNISSSYFTITN